MRGRVVEMMNPPNKGANMMNRKRQMRMNRNRQMRGRVQDT